MNSMKHRRLQELDGSDFEIVQGEPDIRGWDVKISSGQKVGEVEELILDAQKKKVRYMVIDMHDNQLKLDHRKVLMPIGLAQLHREEDDVIIPHVKAEQLQLLPGYDPDQLNPVTERRICEALGRNEESMHGTNEQQQHAEFYQHDYFNTDNLYKDRLHEARPAGARSEYEHGLRLWEKRSEGGIIPNEANARETYHEREMEENARMEMVRNRRNAYEQRRGVSGRDHHRSRDNSIEGRIRDEGLRDA